MDRKYKCKHCDQVFGLVQNRSRYEKVGIFFIYFYDKLKLHQLKFICIMIISMSLLFRPTMYDFQFRMQVQLSNVHKAYC